MEAGYNILSQFAKAREHGHKLWVFGRYDYYDSMFKTQGSVTDNECWGRQVLTAGLNYEPLKGLVVKAEYAHRILKSQYNNEPTLSLGVAYAGFFDF